MTRDGKPLGAMYPARWFFRGHEEEPTTEVALRRGLADDLYIVLAGYDVGTQAAQSPGQSSTRSSTGSGWASASCSIGTFIALLPERAFAFATSKVPDGAATTSLLVLLLVAGGVAAAARAARRSRADRRRRRRSRRSRRTCSSAIICMCGDVRPQARRRVHVPDRRRDARGDREARRAKARRATRSFSTS